MNTYEISCVNESPVISHTTPVNLLQDLWDWEAWKLEVWGIYLLEFYLELLKSCW